MYYFGTHNKRVCIKLADRRVSKLGYPRMAPRPSSFTISPVGAASGSTSAMLYSRVLSGDRAALDAMRTTGQPCTQPLPVQKQKLRIHNISNINATKLTVRIISFSPHFHLISSKRHRSALFLWCRLNMAMFHTGLQQGRSLLGFGLFRQLRLPVPRPNTCSWCAHGRVCF